MQWSILKYTWDKTKEAYKWQNFLHDPHTKIQPQNFLGNGEEDFEVLLPYMDMAAILFNIAEPFKQNGNTLSTENPCEIWWKLL